MSQKLRMAQGLEAVYKCKVKNLGDNNFKIVNLRADIYEKLRNEMRIEIVDTVKPEGVSWSAYAASQKQEAPASTPPPAPTPTVVAGEIPEPPSQDKTHREGESDHDFRVRRMQEGKAYKAWEREYGEAYKAAAAAKTKAEPEAKQMPLPDTGAVDPIKEALEAQGLEDLLNSK